MLHEDQMQDDDADEAADDEPKRKTAPSDRILEDCYRMIFACNYGRYAPRYAPKIFGAYKVSRRDFHVAYEAILCFVEHIESTL